jgi:FixJ family two-component response regulator
VVAIITGYSSEPIAMEAMSLGPLLLIRKPFEVSDIIKVLNMVIKTAGGMR